jgi:hypothetical protein
MKFYLIERDGTGQVVFETALRCTDIPDEFMGSKITKYYENEEEYKNDRDRLESLRESIINSIGEDKIGKVLSSVSPIEALYDRDIHISPKDYAMIFKSGYYVYSVN